MLAEEAEGDVVPVVAGFLDGYLWTRIILTRRFTLSERELQEKPAFYEGLMSAYLYQPRPGGFETALATFEEYKQKFGDDGNYRMWIYVACAHGQKYAWLKDTNGDDTQKEEAVKQARDAIQRAMSGDSSARAWLQELARPGDREGDLVELARDREEIRALLQGEQTQEPKPPPTPAQPAAGAG